MYDFYFRTFQAFLFSNFFYYGLFYCYFFLHCFFCGWFYPNDQGTWSYGRYSLLRFKFPPPGGALTLTLTAGAMVTPAHPQQDVTVSINGEALTTLSFDSVEPQSRTVVIPAALAAQGATGLELRFDYPYARPGTELGPNEDSHLRALRMLSLTLQATPSGS